MRPVVPILALAIATAACARAPRDAEDSGRPSAATSPPIESTSGVTIAAFEYRLGVSMVRSTRSPGRVHLHNDRGFAFIVDRAELVSHSASFVPCAPRRTATLGIDTIRRGVRALAGPSIARAGHGSIADPSTTIAPIVEDLASPASRSWSTRFVTPTRYCRVHYVVARADRETAGAAARPTLEGASLAVDYRYRANTATAYERASLRAEFAHGRLDDLPPAVPEEPRATPRRAIVTIDRNLDRLFDGIDPSADAPRSIERAVLANLLRDTRIDVRLEPLGSDQARSR